MKEKRALEKRAKEKVHAAPKELLRRGLSDGTERLRGQFRDASQRGQQDGCGGDQIEDAAWKGVHWGSRGVELLLKGKKNGGKAVGTESSPDTDFPEAEPPIEAPPSTDGRERVWVKTREAAPRQAEGPRPASRQRSAPGPVHSDASPQSNAKPLKIKTREAVQQTAFSGGTDTLPVDLEQAVSGGPPHIRAGASQPASQLGRRPEPKTTPPAGQGTSQQPLDIKTRDSYIRRQRTDAHNAAEKPTQAREPGQRMERSFFRQKRSAPAKGSSPAYAQGEKEFIQAQGRKEAMKRSGLRRSRRKEALRRTDCDTSASPRSGGMAEPPFRQRITPPLSVGQNGFTPTDGGLGKNSGTVISKGASKGKTTIKVSKNGIQPTHRTARKAVKTAERSAKTAQTAQASAKAPQRAVQAARATAKAGAATAKGVGKAAVSAIRKAVAAAREMAAAIMAGGWVVAVITLIICIVGLLVTSPFGLFFSDPGSGMTIPEAVAQLNGELTAQIEQIKTDNPYDTLDMDESGIAAVTANWPNVLAVYSVCVSSGDGTGASILTSENLAVLRETFWDMTEITYAAETVEHEDEDDEIILHISVTVKTAQQIADEYGFTEEQKALLEEILKPEYQDLFQNLIGSNQSMTLSPQEVRDILSRLPDDLSEERRQVVLMAYQLLGKVNYFWGGKSLVLGWDSRWGTPKEVWAAGSPSTGTIRPYGLDCSGFVDWVFYNVSRGSYIIGHGGGASAQHSYCTGITWEDAQPGDLVFYPGDSHVGIVCGFDSGGNVQIIHCASGSNNVVVTGKIGFATIARPNYYS